MASNSGNDQGKPKGTAKRGFAAMDEATQRSIASKGGQAAHQKGTAHEFDSEEAEGFDDGEQLRDINTPENVMMSKQIATTVNETMEGLPEELRTAITLREIEGLSYEEISAIMNCPIGTVRSRIFRAREAIAEKLRPLLDTSKDRRW